MTRMLMWPLAAGELLATSVPIWRESAECGLAPCGLLLLAALPGLALTAFEIARHMTTLTDEDVVA